MISGEGAGDDDDDDDDDDEEYDNAEKYDAADDADDDDEDDGDLHFDYSHLSWPWKIEALPVEWPLRRC